MKKSNLNRKYHYSIYDNKTGFPVAVNERAERCAELMGLKMSSFYNCVDRCQKGTDKRWAILKHDKSERLSTCGIGEIDKLPKMIRIQQLATFLSTTADNVVGLCEIMGVPIVLAGAQKIRMVARDKFFAKVEQEGRQ